LFPQTAAASDAADLCPENFPSSIETVTHIDCFRVSSAQSDREDAEFLRLQREAECIAEPNSELIRSEIIVDRNGRFFASLTCRISLPVPEDTIACPDDSVEVYRAFNYLACKYFGTAANTEAMANASLLNDIVACESADPVGTVLASSVMVAESADDDEPFFFSELSCGFNIPAIDVFECPVGFEEQSRTEDLLRCEREDEGIIDLDSAIDLNAQVQSICTTTTASLGSVVNTEIFLDTSSNTFESEVDCEIALPRYGEFVDGEILRACDATCTEELEQVRPCINGSVGDPGCTEEESQIVVQTCNTGTRLDSACPLLGVPAANIIPFLLLDEEDSG